MPTASLVRSAVVFGKKEKDEKTLFHLYPADIYFAPGEPAATLVPS
jgi:hypothetical protein